MNQHRSLQPFNKPDERHKKRGCVVIRDSPSFLYQR